MAKRKITSLIKKILAAIARAIVVEMIKRVINFIWPPDGGMF